MRRESQIFEGELIRFSLLKNKIILISLGLDRLMSEVFKIEILILLLRGSFVEVHSLTLALAFVVLLSKRKIIVIRKRGSHVLVRKAKTSTLPYLFRVGSERASLDFLVIIALILVDSQLFLKIGVSVLQQFNFFLSILKTLCVAIREILKLFVFHMDNFFQIIFGSQFVLKSLQFF